MKRDRIKVYIAGPYNGTDVCESIENIAHGLQLNSWLKDYGYLTYCPWSDFLEALFMPGRPKEEWKRDALDELIECDCLMLADENPRWQNSQGTINELATCATHNIPVFLESEFDDFLLGAALLQLDQRPETEYLPYDQEDDGEI